MPKWNASVGLQLTIDYEDIEADTETEAIQIAKDRALEDIDYSNCECDTSDPIVYCCYKEDSDEQRITDFIWHRNGSDDSGREKDRDKAIS